MLSGLGSTATFAQRMYSIAEEILPDTFSHLLKHKPDNELGICCIWMWVAYTRWSRMGTVHNGD